MCVALIFYSDSQTIFILLDIQDMITCTEQ